MTTGADLVTCSNLYGYGPYDGILTEDLPLNATFANGAARAKVWEEAKALHDAGKLRATEVRGSDYIAAGEQSPRLSADRAEDLQISDSVPKSQFFRGSGGAD